MGSEGAAHEVSGGAKEGHPRLTPDDELLVERLGLPIVDEDEHLALLERLDCPVELAFPVEGPVLLRISSVERLLGLLRLDQPPERRATAEVVVLHLLVDAAPNDFADGDPLRGHLQRPLAEGLPAQRLVPDGKGSAHEITPRWMLEEVCRHSPPSAGLILPPFPLACKDSSLHFYRGRGRRPWKGRPTASGSPGWRLWNRRGAVRPLTSACYRAADALRCKSDPVRKGAGGGSFLAGVI